MAALTMTPGTVFVLALLGAWLYFAIRRVRTHGACDSKRFEGDSGCAPGGCSACAGCAAVNQMVADMNKAAGQH